MCVCVCVCVCACACTLKTHVRAKCIFPRCLAPSLLGFRDGEVGGTGGERLGFQNRQETIPSSTLRVIMPPLVPAASTAAAVSSQLPLLNTLG